MTYWGKTVKEKGRNPDSGLLQCHSLGGMSAFMAVKWGGWAKLFPKSARGVHLPIYDLLPRKVLY